MLTVSTTGGCTAIILTISSTSSFHQNVSTSNNTQQHGKPTAECELNASGTGSSAAFDGSSIGGKEAVSQLV